MVTGCARHGERSGCEPRATVTARIKRMRHKFEAIDPAFDEIDSMHGVGYRWRP